MKATTMPGQVSVFVAYQSDLRVLKGTILTGVVGGNIAYQSDLRVLKCKYRFDAKDGSFNMYQSDLRVLK